MSKDSLVWERLPSSIPLCRTPILGGWLVLQPNINDNNEIIISQQISSITFVTDPEHKWDGGMHIFPEQNNRRQEVYNVKELVFDKDKAIEFGRSSNVFRHYRHVENALNKLLRESKSSNAKQLSSEWFNTVVNRICGSDDDKKQVIGDYNEFSFAIQT